MGSRRDDIIGVNFKFKVKKKNFFFSTNELTPTRKTSPTLNGKLYFTTHRVRTFAFWVSPSDLNTNTQRPETGRGMGFEKEKVDTGFALVSSLVGGRLLVGRPPLDGLGVPEGEPGPRVVGPV